jgi:asparagine synthetase B (glutamine-hydrolysing)
MFSSDRKQVLVCNGEIYNYMQIRATLKTPGLIAVDIESCGFLRPSVLVLTYAQ